MCWWSNFGIHIKDVETLRNLAVFMGQQYKVTTKHDLTSIADDKKTPIPHSINHDDRPKFVAVIATILGDTTYPYIKSAEAAAKLAEYTTSEKDEDLGSVLAKSIIASSQGIAREKTGKSDYAIPTETAILIKKFSVAYVNAVKKYIETGPEGLFTIDYLFAELGTSSK